MRPIDRPNQSYQSDGAVPPFDDSRILLVMDGECALCSGAARRGGLPDGTRRIKFALPPSARPLGRPYWRTTA